MNKQTVRASIGIYGNRETGFAYLANAEGVSGVFGDHQPTGKMPHEDATTALFTACADLKARGIVGLACVQFDMKYPSGRTVVRSANIDIGNPPWFGSIAWKETVVR